MAEPRVVADWVLQQRAGSGSFAVVWKAMHKDSGKVVAIKEISTDRLNRKLKQSLESEVSILKQIHHKNIVHLQDVFYLDSSYLYLVMEYCAGGDLAGYIRRCKRVPEVTACAVMRQLGAGLKELWSRHMVHRDLKPQNLLLSDNTPQAVLKIADFGFARHLQQQELADTLCGSPLYMAPEILQSQKYDAKADLWSVGTILYELVVGRPPFNGSNHVVLLQNIERHEAKIPDQIARHLSPACIDLIYSLLKRNPVQRISFEEFFSHPFLAANSSMVASSSCQAAAAEPQSNESGLVRPVQRIAGQAANGPEDSLPFVLDDDAVAPAFQQPLQGQILGNDLETADPVQSNRPRYGHRSPASALAGRQLVHAISKQRPPLGASPRPSGPLSAAKPPSFPSTPPLTAAALPSASFQSSTQVQGRPVSNHPLQGGRVSNSMGSSLEDDGFVIVNVPSPSSSGHQPISRRPSGGLNILTRLRSDTLLSPQRHHYQQQQQQPQQQQQHQQQHQHQQQRQERQSFPLSPSPSAVAEANQMLHQGAQANPIGVQQGSQGAQGGSLPQQLSQTAGVPGSQQNPGLSQRHASGEVQIRAKQQQQFVPQAAVVVVEPEQEPAMGDRQGLAAMAALLEGFAVECEGKEQLQQSLSLRLLALQLLLLMLKESAAPDSASQTASDATSSQSGTPTLPEAATTTGEAKQTSSAQHSVKGQQADLATAASASSKQAKRMLADMYTEIQETVQLLHKDNESASLPYCWQVVYELALDLARTGAMQEIIGKLDSAVVPYSQAVQVLVFLHSVAERLSLQPQLKLVSSDRLRLQQYSLQLRIRQAVCKAAMQASNASDLH